jgi:Flp pilus assembly CpaF family ATPase
LANLIPDDERLVVIEHTTDIQIQKQNALRSEARRKRLPAVTIQDLLKATLRRRPDCTILSEIRGEFVGAVGVEIASPK